MGIRGAAVKMASTALPVGITVGASPYIYQNISAGIQSVIVSGGTVSLLEYSRDGATYFAAGLIAGLFSLNPSDRLRITYAVLPTMTSVQIN